MSVVHIILDPNAEFGYHKSHDCLIHVWSFGSSIGGQNLSDTDTNLNLSESVPGNRLLILGSLFATLLSTDRKGQILELIPFSYPSLNSEESSQIFWLWTSEFVSLDKPSKKQHNTSTGLANLNFSVNGQLIYPFSNCEPQSIDVETILDLLLTSGYSDFEALKLEKLNTTWRFANIELERAQNELINAYKRMSYTSVLNSLLQALFETEYFHTQLPIIQPLLNHWKMGITHATSVELQLNPRTDNTI
ncbi:hypothetical protein BDQ17DRAFT_1332784 [Cyathus striatus]|nr:hypothetical protein BDQ17DRAFT_1332784 [Cyathus striatus]